MRLRPLSPKIRGTATAPSMSLELLPMSFLASVEISRISLATAEMTLQIRTRVSTAHLIKQGSMIDLAIILGQDGADGQSIKGSEHDGSGPYGGHAHSGNPGSSEGGHVYNDGDNRDYY